MSAGYGSNHRPWWKNPKITVPAVVAILAAIIGPLLTATLQPRNTTASAGSSPTINGSSPPVTLPTTSSSSMTASISPVPTSPSATPQSPQPQYNSVSFNVLCSSQNATQSDFQDCSDEQAAKIGQNLYDFSTWAPAYDPASDNDPPLLSFPSTTCRSLSLRFAIQPSQYNPSNLRVTVSVVSQGSRSVTIAPNQLGKLNVTLSGGPFEIDASASLPMGGGWTLLMDGSASCSTNSGS
jgi:hypothetical protein